MVHHYKSTHKNELAHLSGVLPGVIVFLIFVPALYYLKRADYDFWDYVAFVGLWFMLTYIIPFTVLYLRYDMLSAVLEIEFDDVQNTISITNSKLGTVTCFCLDELVEVRHVMTPAFYERRIELFPWDSFNYSVLRFSSGEIFVVTSLLVTRLTLPVGEKYEVDTSLFPYPSIDPSDTNLLL